MLRLHSAPLQNLPWGAAQIFRPQWNGFAGSLFSWQLRLIGNRLQILVYLFHCCSCYWSLLCAVASSEVPVHGIMWSKRSLPSIPWESLLLHESADLEYVMCTVLWNGFCSMCWFQVQLALCKMCRLLIKVMSVFSLLNLIGTDNRYSMAIFMPGWRWIWVLINWKVYQDKLSGLVKFTLSSIKYMMIIGLHRESCSVKNTLKPYSHWNERVSIWEVRNLQRNCFCSLPFAHYFLFFYKVSAFDFM